MAYETKASFAVEEMFALTSLSSSITYDHFEYKRSRSNSPDFAPYLIDLSYMDLEECEEDLKLCAEKNAYFNVTDLLLNNNLLKTLPRLISNFNNLEILDLSSNCLKILHDDLCKLFNLKVLIVKDNLLNDMSIPKDFSSKLTKLEIINLSGNLLTQFPYQLLELITLRECYLGSNKLTVLPRNYECLQNLEILYLGGNQIRVIPDEFSQLKALSSLNLSDNQIISLPNSLVKLKNIKNLAVHGNNLTTLPIELVKLNLKELSLRNNPLVKRFAKDFVYNVPSLLELCGRVIKIKSVQYDYNHLPKHLVDYLNSAQCCLNPKCKGVYFTSKVEHIKFVDFCGKFRVPLMQYLCSSTCSEKVTNRKFSESFESDNDDNNVEDKLLKKILIG